MYDGGHHTHPDQRDVDSGVNATLAAAGLPVLRVTRRMIWDQSELMGYLRPMLARVLFQRPDAA